MLKPINLQEAVAAAELNGLAQTRRAMRALLAAPKARAQGLARVEDVSVGGAAGVLPARYYEAPHAHPGPLLVYFHGGGFCICDIDTHDSICSHLAMASGGRVLSVGYRLAPEARYPAQLEDAKAAGAWALKHAVTFGAAPDRIAVGGDSAGAYLAANVASAFNALAPGAVALQVLFYPLVHIEDSVWAEEELRNFRFLGRLAVYFIGRNLGAKQFPSLLDLDHACAPPTIIAGGGPMDPVRADVKAYADRLRRSGVRVLEKKYQALMHGGLNFTAYSKTALAALAEVGGLIRGELAPPAAGG
ncbi:MAG: alpha/beta hydrolase [Hyphomonadaceae bacterium]